MTDYKKADKEAKAEGYESGWYDDGKQNPFDEEEEPSQWMMFEEGRSQGSIDESSGAKFGEGIWFL